MKLNKKYIYPKTIREAINGKRHYNINDGKYKLPSVTTILSATQHPEKTASLDAWRLKMGEDMQRGSWKKVPLEAQLCTRY